MTLLQSLVAKVRRHSQRRAAPAARRARLAIELLEAREVPSTFSIIDLGTLGGSNSYAFGINEQGQVVGTAQTAAGVNQAFLWQDGAMTDLGTPHASTARGINGAGQVVGVDVASSGEASTSTAFLWDGGVLDLFATRGSGSAINDAGQAAGQYQAGSGSPAHAFLYEDGTLTDLGTLGGAISQAHAINNAGQVAGTSQYNASPFFHAFLWQNGVMTDLGQLAADATSTAALGINDAGVVVGYSGNAAFIFDSAGMRDLNVPTAFSAAAYDINNAGQIVGVSSTYAFWIDAGGSITDLNTLIPEGTDWSLTSANAINDAGQIVGVGWRGGVQHAFLLNPEAATFSLWDDSATPSGQISDGPVELGVRFQSNVTGHINGIRFHKGPQNTGTHVGNLWDSNGNLLATAVFTSESASGWQQVQFDAPVAIQANTTYVASYHTDTGYAFDHFYFTDSFSNGPLTALADGGVYAYGTGGFPSETYRSSNYWVDVVFTPGAVPPPAPEGAQAIGGSSGQVTVAWLATPTADGYNIYRSTTQGGQGSVPYQTGVTGVELNGFLTYVDTNVTNGTTYYYQISAVNEVGEGERSNEVGATPIGPVGPPFSLFTPSMTPTIAAANDNSPVELGVKFYADVDGSITSIRFYRGVAIDTGYVVNLWTEDGMLLRTANVIEGQGPTPGWQQVSFAPVAITAGTTYVASYFASAGGYAFNFGFFAENGIDSGPLHAPAGENGVYTYGSGGGFPNQTYNSSNYWVDVVFEPAATEFSLWNDATTPTVAAALDDTNPVELGVQFTSDVNGYISAIRFYRGVAIDSGYTVNLWNADGALLATGVVIEGQSPTPGWQTVTFAPVAISAGTTYVASYFASTGQYAYDHDFFAAGSFDNGPLHALNGFYHYGTGGGFPDQTYRSSNYWIDVVFQTEL